MPSPRSPAMRTAQLTAGGLLIVGAGVVAPLPGPGGIFLFAGGMVLILRNSRRARVAMGTAQAALATDRLAGRSRDAPPLRDPPGGAREGGAPDAPGALTYPGGVAMRSPQQGRPVGGRFAFDADRTD